MSDSSRVISVLGSTGSIGQSTLAVLEASDNFQVHALTANSNIELLLEQCEHFQPRYAVVSDEAAAERMSALLDKSDCDTKLLSGSSALEQVASDPAVDLVMAAIVGATGLSSTLAAAAAGKQVLLANKEALVMSGDLFMETARQSNAKIIPIDSEHNAIFQCLSSGRGGAGANSLAYVDKVVLTASGGPFLDVATDAFPAITPAQAVAHPRWKMGQKISVDSATLMNKGLEFIEACYLFSLPPERIEVLIHPQSIIHSMVYFLDGSVLAQLASPDMRVPIAYGLSWPHRMASGAPALDLLQQGPLEFRDPDLLRFPCLRLGMEAAVQKGTAPAVLNAANEVAVAAFLAGRIKFDQVFLINQQVMSKIPCEAASSLAIIRDIDSEARKLANKLI